MLRMSFQGFEFVFEWLEVTFDCFDSLSKGLYLHSNTFRIVRHSIRMLQIPFEWVEFEFESFELAFKCLECALNG